MVSAYGNWTEKLPLASAVTVSQTVLEPTWNNSTVAFGSVAVRLSVPLAVASADSVIVEVELSTVKIVTPYGMPEPAISSPANSPVVLVRPVTCAEPAVNVPVKLAEAVPMKSGSRSAVTSLPTIDPVVASGSSLKLVGGDGFVRMIVNVTGSEPGLVPLLLLATASTVNVPDVTRRVRERQSERAGDWIAGCGHHRVKRAAVGLKQLHRCAGRRRADEVGRGDIGVSRCTGVVVGGQFQSRGLWAGSVPKYQLRQV